MCLRPSHGLGVSINNSLTMFEIHYLKRDWAMFLFFCQWLDNMSHKEMYCLWCYLYAHLIPCWKLWLNIVSTPGQMTTTYRSPYVYCFTKHCSVYSLKTWTAVSFTAFQQKINTILFNFLKALNQDRVKRH